MRSVTFDAVQGAKTEETSVITCGVIAWWNVADLEVSHCDLGFLSLISLVISCSILLLSNVLRLHSSSSSSHTWATPMFR